MTHGLNLIRAHAESQPQTAQNTRNSQHSLMHGRRCASVLDGKKYTPKHTRTYAHTNTHAHTHTRRHGKTTYSPAKLNKLDARERNSRKSQQNLPTHAPHNTVGIFSESPSSAPRNPRLYIDRPAGDLAPTAHETKVHGKRGVTTARPPSLSRPKASKEASANQLRKKSKTDKNEKKRKKKKRNIRGRRIAQPLAPLPHPQV